MMVDFKFDALYRYVVMHREPSEVGLVGTLSGNLYFWVELGVPSVHRESAVVISVLVCNILVVKIG